MAAVNRRELQGIHGSQEQPLAQGRGGVSRAHRAGLDHGRAMPVTGASASGLRERRV